jgi:hypothetical protein
LVRNRRKLSKSHALEIGIQQDLLRVIVIARDVVGFEILTAHGKNSRLAVFGAEATETESVRAARANIFAPTSAFSFDFLISLRVSRALGGLMGSEFRY